MYRTSITLLLAIVFAFSCAKDASAGGKRNVSYNGEFSFQLESSGRILPIYNHRGRSYLEGHFGDHYAIRVFNHSGRRVEATVTVDGRDVITGKQGNFRAQRGYVIQPYSSVLIDGFRKNMNRVAAFRFTDVGDSYAARMGDASNVGVIGVAIFKERSYRPKPRPQITYDRHDERLGTGYGGSSKSKRAPAAKSAPRHRYEATDDLAESGRSYHSQGLGTQYGTDTYSPVTNTRFVRSNSRRPDTVLSVRYDDRQGLIALGVLPRPRPHYRREPLPDPFPSSQGFAPPPPRYYRE